MNLQYDIGELNHEHDGRRDRDLDLCTQLGADLDLIRAALVRTIWTLTRGVSDPACRACADPDAREAGSLTPPTASLPLFSGRPGRHKAPADTDAAAAQVSATMRLRNRWVWRDDDRPCTAVVIMPMVDGAADPLAIGPPPRPPRVETWPRTEASKGREKTPSERVRLDEIGA